MMLGHKGRGNLRSGHHSMGPARDRLLWKTLLRMRTDTRYRWCDVTHLQKVSDPELLRVMPALSSLVVKILELKKPNKRMPLQSAEGRQWSDQLHCRRQVSRVRPVVPTQNFIRRFSLHHPQNGSQWSLHPGGGHRKYPRGPNLPQLAHRPLSPGTRLWIACALNPLPRNYYRLHNLHPHQLRHYHSYPKHPNKRNALL
jgi:hypothetical protein